KFQCAELVKLFDWKKLVNIIKDFAELVPGKKLPDTATAIQLSRTLLDRIWSQQEVAQKFQQQLNYLLPQLTHNSDTSLLKERVSKAIAHFPKAIIEDLLLPLREHLNSLQHASKVRKYLHE